MRLKTLFNRNPKESTLPLFDEAFLRRLERLSFHTVPALRGSPLGERRSRNLRPALDFSDHRPYSHGDDLRHVDWNAYGRHEELFVKLGEATQSVNIHILLDCSRSMAWTPAAKSSDQRVAAYSKWDAARRLAGALGYLGLAGGERVEITPFGHTLAEGFGPTEGKRRVIPILKFLSTITPLPPLSRGGTGGDEQDGLVDSLTSYARTHPAGGLLVLISDLLDTATSLSSPSPLEGRVGEGLRHLIPPRWQVLVVHLLTEEEVHPTLEGDYDLQDTETGESLPFHLNEATLIQYRLRVRKWCAELQSACAQRGATYARILAEWPLEQAVIPYLRQRGVVQ
jgi:uncharacterized protein (DUF58 family)